MFIYIFILIQHVKNNRHLISFVNVPTFFVYPLGQEGEEDTLIAMIK